MCVRLCDGFYWPISNSTSRSRFAHDAETCSASCEAESKLFYVAANGDPADMTDLHGRPYAKLATAFKYRKAVDDSCRCKPRPWERPEIERHRRYAEAESSRNNAKTPEVITIMAEVASDNEAAPATMNEAEVAAPASNDAATAKPEIEAKQAEHPPAPLVPAKSETSRKPRSPLLALIEEHRRQTRTRVTVSYVKKQSNSGATLTRKPQ